MRPNLNFSRSRYPEIKGFPPMHCLCCGIREGQGCVKGFPCSCDPLKHCRVCNKCTRHCKCEWKVTVLIEGKTQSYHESKDFDEVEKQVGHLAMLPINATIIVNNNGKEYRRIDAR